MHSCDSARKKKHSVEINGRSSSLSLEAEFWLALKAMADQQELTVQELVTRMASRPGRRTNLTSEVRVRLLQWYQSNDFKY